MPVLVTAPSRLHLGMFSFGRPDVRQFGGVGLMVDEPSTRLDITTASQFQVSGPQAERASEFAHRLVGAGLLESLPTCHVRVLQTPPSHVGLGTGTQLALAVARGLLTYAGVGSPAADELARRLGRGRRSAVGSYGFDFGGLIVEAGKFSSAGVPKLELGNEGVIGSPLVERVELPAAWRFVLLVPRGDQGLWGPDEEAAFGRLPPVPPATTENLLREAHSELLPAARDADFDRFAGSVYRFGKLAGTCFATAQHGCFASPAVEERIEWLRAHGVRGVAQSSWGPTVLAVLPDEEQAKSVANPLASRTDAGELDVIVTAANNRGAVIEANPSPEKR